MAPLRITLERLVGIPPLLLGMPIHEAAVVMERWGVVTVTPGSGPVGPVVNAREAEYSCDIYANFDDGEHVSSIVVWRPEGTAREVAVLFEGIDIFRQEASDVIAQLQQRGHILDDSDPFFPMFEDISLGFNQEFRGDAKGEDDYGPARYFANVLLASPKP